MWPALWAKDVLKKDLPASLIGLIVSSRRMRNKSLRLLTYFNGYQNLSKPNYAETYYWLFKKLECKTWLFKKFEYIKCWVNQNFFVRLSGIGVRLNFSCINIHKKLKALQNFGECMYIWENISEIVHWLNLHVCLYIIILLLSPWPITRRLWVCA